MELPKRQSQFSAGPGASEASGPVYTIVPAHDGSNADSVARELSSEFSEAYRLSVLLADFCSHGFPVLKSAEAPQRLDPWTRGALVTPGEVFDTWNARETDPGDLNRILNFARTRYHVTCADLSEARESSALEVLRHSDSIFLIANSDAASIEQARIKADWLRSVALGDRAALLLNRIAGGIGGGEAEDATGFPVCATLGKSLELQRLAEWLAAPLLPNYMLPGAADTVLRAGQ